MPVSSLIAAVFSIITMLQAGQLPGASCGVPSLLHPQGGQTYCFFSCAALVRVRVARVSEPATTNSLRFIWVVLSKFELTTGLSVRSLEPPLRGLRMFAVKCGQNGGNGWKLVTSCLPPFSYCLRDPSSTLRLLPSELLV